jgi:hypothetical protein
MPAKTLDVQVVTWRPEPGLLGDLLASLTEPRSTAGRSCCGSATTASTPTSSPRPATSSRPALAIRFWRRSISSRPSKIADSAAATTRCCKRGRADFVLLLNQDVVLEPNALKILLDEAYADDPRVAAWEMRQIPYEHPKSYDPANGDVPWVSGAAVLLRREALAAVGGFEPRIFLYGEDVDLSWRLRASGWRLRYVARAAVQHLTYNYPDEIKRNQVLGGTLSNLLLRARFGSWRDIAHGVMLICGELFVPQAFPGRRRGLAANLAKFAFHFPYFRLTKVTPKNGFAPEFRGWNYELRRDGAFHVFRSRRPPAGSRPDLPAVEPAPPLVSILIRTCDPAGVAQAGVVVGRRADLPAAGSDRRRGRAAQQQADRRRVRRETGHPLPRDRRARRPRAGRQCRARAGVG